MRKHYATLILMMGFATASHATPLRLDYSVTPLVGGIFDYNFMLKLDNHDNSWSSGQIFNWIVFGDCLGSDCVVPLSDFVGDNSDLPIGPFNEFSYSYGSHNGPTLFSTLFSHNLGFFGGWAPSALNESLAWSGTSTANLTEGSLLWSNLFGWWIHADFEIAHRVPEIAHVVLQPESPVPIPATIWLVASVLAGLTGVGYQRRKQLMA